MGHTTCNSVSAQQLTLWMESVDVSRVTFLVNSYVKLIHILVVSSKNVDRHADQQTAVWMHVDRCGQ